MELQGSGARAQAYFADDAARDLDSLVREERHGVGRSTADLVSARIHKKKSFITF